MASLKLSTAQQDALYRLLVYTLSAGMSEGTLVCVPDTAAVPSVPSLNLTKRQLRSLQVVYCNLQTLRVGRSQSYSIRISSEANETRYLSRKEADDMLQEAAARQSQFDPYRNAPSRPHP